MNYAEENMQIACVRWFDLQFPALRMALHHSPNGGYRTEKEGAKFKAMGTRKGYPDIVIQLRNHEGYDYLAIELKTKTGHQTAEQKAYQQFMEGHGGKYVVVRSFDDFMKEVKSYIYRPTEMPPEHEPNPYKKAK